MALLERNMMKTVLGNTDLELEADPGESFLIKDIWIANPASNYIDVKIRKTSVGYFRVGGPLGGHLNIIAGRTQHAHDWRTSSTVVGDQTSFAGLEDAGNAEVAGAMIGGLSADTTYKRVGRLNPVSIPRHETILGYLLRRGIFKGYPVQSGDSLLISGAAQSGAVQIVIYDRYDEGDITGDAENGPDSKTYFYINYGNCGGNISTAGDHEINTPKNPSEYINFPFGGDVPSRHTIELHGILASDFAPKANDGTDGSGTQYLKITKEREVLFDEDRNGLLLYAKDYGDDLVINMVAEGYSVIGNFSDVDSREPYMLEEPLVFTAGDEVIFAHTLVAEGAGKNLGIDDHEVGVILKVTAE